MTTQRILLWLTLTLGTVASGFCRVIPQPEILIPLALRDVEIRSVSERGPFDENINLRVNSDNTAQIQNEEQVCISPILADYFVAVWRDFRLGYRRVGVGYSHDNGATWHDELFPAMYFPWQSDPVLVVDADGNFTAMVISLDPAQGGEDGLLQVSSYDGGVTWQDSAWAALAMVPVGFEDKEMLAVDVSGSEYHGTFYCAWTHFYGPGPWYDSTHVWLTYKRPGQPYSDEHVLSQTASNQWPNVCVGENGQVYVTWVSFSYSAVMFSRSLDGGDTWAPETQAVPTHFASVNIEPDLAIFAYGAMACDLSNGPHRGRLYMIYTDSDDDFTETDVFLVHSDDQGDTWSPRVRLNDEPQDHHYDNFHPWISVDDSGRVWAVFYDRRNDPYNLLMDVYFTVSEDGGQTWRANERITTVSSDPAAGSLDAGLIGEYIGWQARGDKAVCVWTDTRLGNQDAFASVIDSVFIIDSAPDQPASVPAAMALAAFPNPVNNATTLNFTLARSTRVQLKLYDITGRLVQTGDLGTRAAGEHHQNISLNGLASGIYFAELAGENSDVARTKIMLLK